MLAEDVSKAASRKNLKVFVQVKSVRRREAFEVTLNGKQIFSKVGEQR